MRVTVRYQTLLNSAKFSSLIALAAEATEKWAAKKLIGGLAENTRCPQSLKSGRPLPALPNRLRRQ